MRAVITGCAGGIGSALCRSFHEGGWAVTGIDVRDCGGVCSDHVFVDLRKLETASVRPPADAKVLVNNAAVQRVAATKDITAEDWQETLAVNLTAPLLLAQTFAPVLEQNRGSIINIASVHAVQTKPAFVAYATSKSALVGLTRSLAIDLAGRVRVNAVCPAAVDTAMLRESFAGRAEAFARLAETHPVGRIGTPSDIAAIAMFLASDAAAFVTGTVLFADGGITARLHDPL